MLTYEIRGTNNTHLKLEGEKLRPLCKFQRSIVHFGVNCLYSFNTIVKIEESKYSKDKTPVISNYQYL